jgi:ketosteroid isomerase-like protein
MTTDELIRGYFDSVNREQWDRLGELFAEDGTYRTMGARSRHGRAEVVAFFRDKAFAAWAVHHDEPCHRIIDGGFAAVEVAFTGTTHDGREIGFDAVDLFSVAEGTIAGVSTWYDIGLVRGLLAVATS